MKIFGLISNTLVVLGVLAIVVGVMVAIITPEGSSLMVGSIPSFPSKLRYCGLASLLIGFVVGLFE